MNARIATSIMNAESIAGPFSLVGDEPLHLNGPRGLVVHVRAGALAIRHATDRDDRILPAGTSFVATRAGALVMDPAGRAELCLEWPTGAARPTRHARPFASAIGRARMEPVLGFARPGP